ncbi:phosphotransferase [Aquimarina sp. 2201CG5-10]|uniref:phosphotransferase n=1 Tax=Aquimarina callyspongiae TaxID=3098150 RepID=UPI002AB45599|nr:phosphotransferase [Aquimarina sp. 2201CG5-10]MDY8135898.1 phosphotransferase [Aquimarina sp. 2201CG5-10]
MAQYTVLNIEEIKEIIANYSVGNVDSFKILSGGSENTNYLVVCGQNKYVLTICEQKTLQKTVELAKLLEHLSKHNFPTSQIIQSRKNEAAILWNQKPILLKKYLPGTICKNLSPRLLQSIGRSLGKLHQIEAPEYLPNVVSYGKDFFEEIHTYNQDSSFYPWLMQIKEQVQNHISTNLLKTLIHSDLFYNNIIVNDNNNRATIMDFEEASYYYRVFDLGMTFVGLCSDNEIIDLQNVGYILNGYLKEIQLTIEEINAIKVFTIYAAAGTAFWRYKHFNYIQPDPKMFKHYIAMKNLADHIKSLPDDCFAGLIKV